MLRATCKSSFSPNLYVMLKFYPRNINYMPAVKFFTCLDLERKYYFCKMLLILLFFAVKNHACTSFIMQMLKKIRV